MAVTKEQVAELYVAYFNRAPDTEGLDYWVNSDLEIEEISSSFYMQEETTFNYPHTMTDSIFVNTIYLNLFNRNADPTGLVYWENELANETVSRPNMILAITKGAVNAGKIQDVTILNNKTEVGLYSADAGVNNVKKSIDVMKDVDASGESVKAAKELADNYGISTLTTKQDTFIGTDKDDVIDGLLSASGSTYTAGDTIDGGEGDDIFKLNIVGGSDISAPIKNVETIEISGTAILPLNAFNWSDTEHYSFVGNMAQTINNINHEVSSLTSSNVRAGAIIEILNFATKDVQDTNSDKLDITLKDSNQVVTVATQVATRADNIYEELTIHSIDNSNGAGLTFRNGGDITEITLDGNSDITLNILGSTANEILDASTFTGQLTYLSGSSVVETIKGGSDDDIITFGGTGGNVWGGAGSDTLNGGAGIDNFKYDKLSVESGVTTVTADIISMNTGSDAISFRGLDAGTADNFYQTNLKADVITIEKAVAEAEKGTLTNKMYVEYTNAKTFLVIDSDGDGKADGAMELNAPIGYSDIVIY
ncbi:MAG: DUF4214 domain-containing protein [Sulfurovum sp.]|nr:DUF4214 domain-containing protein [Sulfurovaceae bacterium]